MVRFAIISNTIENINTNNERCATINIAVNLFWTLHTVLLIIHLFRAANNSSITVRKSLFKNICKKLCETEIPDRRKNSRSGDGKSWRNQRLSRARNFLI